MPTTTKSQPLEKLLTGIEGFDDITEGGLPKYGTTLLMGGPGCGKTVLAMQILVNRAVQHGAAGIFVAFEENALNLSANARTFGWEMEALEKKKLYLMDATLRADVVTAGTFDLSGLLIALEAKARLMGAKVIVFDAIDVLLTFLNDVAAETRELRRIHEWLQRLKLTGILTTKLDSGQLPSAQRYGFLPYLADCIVLLKQTLAQRVALRTLQITKYRGSSHVLNETPFVIGPDGIEVGSSNGVHPEPQPFTERISTGVERLDEMLGGGLFRGTNALLTGSSGTGKSSLAGAFIEASCNRGEQTLYISFDENACDIVRDLSFLGIDLAPHLVSGLLQMTAIRTESGSSEEHFMRIRRIIGSQEPRCVAIDPISALANVGGALAARAVSERLIYFCRNAGITILFTSLPEGVDPHLETTPMHLSTIADSWIHISYALLDGERNRALSIIKSRGTKHSPQLRELLFAAEGITLADPYTAGGTVLLGTLRQEKEHAQQSSTSEKVGDR